MKQKTVEKPGRRQPTLPRLRIVDCRLPVGRQGLRIAGFSLLLSFLLAEAGWSQNNPPITPSSGLAQVDQQQIRNPQSLSADRQAAIRNPAPAPALVTSPGYRLHQGDKIEVRFFYQPELNQETVVNPDGMVSLQLIGDVRAQGLTVQELEQQLTQQYSQVLVDPTISVMLKDYVKPRVFIGGEVTKPGPYELRDGDMLAQALLLAGGFTPQAHRKMVLVARPMGEGDLRVTVVDATKLYTRHPDPELNLALKDGDLIYVPESKLSRISDILYALKLQTFGFVIDPFRRR